MSTSTYNDALDTRLAFKVYAVVAWTVGGLLYGWPMWFRMPLAGFPLADEMVPRLAAAALLCSGFLAIAMARTLDDDGRRRALGWWAVGHAAAFVGVFIQLQSVVGFDRLGWGGAAALGWLLGTALLFGFLWQTAEGLPWSGWSGLASPRHSSVLRELRQPGVRHPRSTYEETIRAAASQEERHRLARDLHDSIKQQIFVMHTS